MGFKIATWNVNSVRLRVDIIERLLREERPDVLCLQELKCQEEFFPLRSFKELGYGYSAVRGQKSYNGVAIISRLPIRDEGSLDLLDNVEARHVAASLANGVRIENFYVPAGGDVPDRDANKKFADKLDYLAAMRDWSRSSKPARTILVGDLNVAPLEDDVWSHRQLINVVSHTPVEVDHLSELTAAGPWVDVVRKSIPSGKLYSWWSYRARDWRLSDRGRRLDHIWATSDLAESSRTPKVRKDARGWERPSDHAPVLAEFDF